MHASLKIASFGLVVMIAQASVAVAQTGDTGSRGSVNPYAGTYSGTEILSGGTFPIKVQISKKGKITIIDVENYRGSSKLKGNRFRIKRSSPYQVFKGRINGRKIIGVTTGNRTYGNGTFSAVKIYGSEP